MQMRISSSLAYGLKLAASNYRARVTTTLDFRPMSRPENLSTSALVIRLVHVKQTRPRLLLVRAVCLCVYVYLYTHLANLRGRLGRIRADSDGTAIHDLEVSRVQVRVYGRRSDMGCLRGGACSSFSGVPIFSVRFFHESQSAQHVALSQGNNPERSCLDEILLIASQWPRLVQFCLREVP